MMRINYEFDDSIDHLNIPQRTILLVDDDPFNIYALQKLFECLKLPTTATYSGITALDFLREGDITHIGLILMDCNMPVMDGLEVFITHFIYIYIYL